MYRDPKQLITYSRRATIPTSLLSPLLPDDSPDFKSEGVLLRSHSATKALLTEQVLPPKRKTSSRRGKARSRQRRAALESPKRSLRHKDTFDSPVRKDEGGLLFRPLKRTKSVRYVSLSSPGESSLK
jgi:hypothetical protein